MTAERVVGQTAESGFQIGVRRTLPYSEDALWSAVLSPEGMRIWLGGPTELESGAAYSLENGTTGQIRVYAPGSHLRLTWQPSGWERPSVVQIRVIPAKKGTTLSFHQEQLDGASTREAMRAHWEDVIARLGDLARASTGRG